MNKDTEAEGMIKEIVQRYAMKDLDKLWLDQDDGTEAYIEPAPHSAQMSTTRWKKAVDRALLLEKKRSTAMQARWELLPTNLISFYYDPTTNPSIMS